MYGLERITATGSILGGDAAGSLIPGNPARRDDSGGPECPASVRPW